MPRVSSPEILDRYARAFKWVPPDSQRILDYGCGDGRLIGRLAREEKGSLWYGCDVDAEKTILAQQHHSRVEFIHMKGARLPFEDGFFDVVCMLNVLEHVEDESRTLQEIARVLRCQGTLILSVPHKGAFAGLDPGNIKFRSPELHRVFHRFIVRDADSYHRGLEDLSDNPRGDIKLTTNSWHRHYSVAQVSTLLKPYFHIVQMQLFGLLVPIYDLVNYLMAMVAQHESRLVSRLRNWDQSIELGRLSYDVAVRAIRR